MPDYTKINFADIEDTAAGRAYDVQGRFARKYLQSEHLGVSQFSYGSGVRAPYGHRHQEQEEVYVVTGGSGRVKLDEEIVELRRGDVVRVAPAVVRAFEAGAEGLELIAVGSDRPEGGDGEMIEDFWTD
jgi:mannose-6-phosphate isomerase-like protein (cupin superfamily)